MVEALDDSRWLKVMIPFHVDVHRRVVQHRHGTAASVLFVWLLAAARVGSYQEPGGWVVMSGSRLQWLGLSPMSRIRGLRALEELGLIELRQEGRQAYRARLLYDGSALEGELDLSGDPEVTVPDMTDHYAERFEEHASCAS